MEARSQRDVLVQRIWSPFLRSKSINLKELMALRMVLEYAAVSARLTSDHSLLLLHINNMGVFPFCSNMVFVITQN